VSGEQLVADAELISKFFAKRVTASVKKGAVNEVELAERIGEIELETQILGASFLKVHIIDPELTLLNSGWLEMREGLLLPVTVEFPEGSGWKWIICACEPSTEVAQANLEVTFESIIVAELREFWGPKQAPPGTRTRAQFARELLTEAKIPSVIPGLNIVQPVEEEEKDEAGTVIVQSALEKQRTEAQVNKMKGVGHGSTVTIKGEKPTADQLALLNQVIHLANSEKAGQLATEALLEACIQENTFSTGGEGLLQFLPSTASALGIQKGNVEQEVKAFLTRSYAAGTSSVGSGGAIEYAKKKPHASADEVAQAAQGSAFPEAYGQWQAEARVMIESFGGLTLGGTATTTTESDVAQLTRGTPSNPDEDSFEAIQRLASQVNWFAFTSQVPRNPEMFFYMDGPELARQKPSAYIDVQQNYCINAHTGRKEYGVVLQPTTGTVDNTTFEFRRTHKVKARVQRRSKVAKPSTPAEVRLQLVCGITDYRAGDVFVIRGFGPLNGRWIVSDTTRNCLKDTFTKFVLEPPVEPLPEPVATVKGAETTGEGKSSVAEQAKKALAEQKAKPGTYKYVYGGGHQAAFKLFGPTPRECDCSAFASGCYREAGAPVPGQSGSTLPATNEMIAAMKKTSDPQPGDLCFFGPSETDTKHVTVYVGGGMAISMGQEGDPEEGPYKTTGPAGFLGVYTP
jgi:cell wall-associated NlpC family hydrolase